MKQILFLLLVLFSTHCFAEPIIFNTLPKSGSVYIVTTLSEGLKKGKIMSISNNTFPWDPIFLSNFKTLVETDSITQEHFDASVENIAILREKCPKLIIHVRDPRQAVISWTHHLNAIQHSKETLDYFLLPLPEKYFQLSFTEQLAWQIEHYFPTCIEWIQNWVKVSKDEELNILFTTYESFLDNREAFFQKIFDFYSINDSIEKLPTLPKKEATHFRKGRIDEWREVMSQEQQKKVTNMIPEDLFTKFNWKP